MSFFLLGIGLFVVLIIYLRLARRHAIMDVPNERSSHLYETVVGGGFVIPLAFIGWSVFYTEINLYLIAAILVVSSISLIDDLRGVQPLVRFMAQVLAISFILFELDILEFLPYPFIVVLIGLVYLSWINAFNFMDGINGMMAGYGLLTILTLLFLNERSVFIESSIIIATGIGILVFGFFNFRRKALCFAGDVGSISLAILLGYFFLKLLLQTGDITYLILVVVYGIDSAGTILERLIKKENIFRPHRLHLYQRYANDRKRSHLAVSSAYMAVQLLVNIGFLYVIAYESKLWSIAYCVSVFVTLLLVYMFLKLKIFKVFEPKTQLHSGHE